MKGFDKCPHCGASTTEYQTACADCVNVLNTFNQLQADIHNNAKAHGWWDTDRTFGEVIALAHSELSEALEEHRTHKQPAETYYSFDAEGNKKPEGIPAELADCVIRIMDYCGRTGINLAAAILEKHAYNKTRPHKHGGKFI